MLLSRLCVRLDIKRILSFSISEAQMSSPIFIAKTVQSSSFKNLIEDVKDIIQDANFILDTHGVSLTAMDESKIVLVRLYLEADKFEHYSCVSRQTIGLKHA